MRRINESMTKPSEKRFLSQLAEWLESSFTLFRYYWLLSRNALDAHTPYNIFCLILKLHNVIFQNDPFNSRLREKRNRHYRYYNNERKSLKRPRETFSTRAKTSVHCCLFRKLITVEMTLERQKNNHCCHAITSNPINADKPDNHLRYLWKNLPIFRRTKAKNLNGNNYNWRGSHALVFN